MRKNLINCNAQYWAQVDLLCDSAASSHGQDVGRSKEQKKQESWQIKKADIQQVNVQSSSKLPITQQLHHHHRLHVNSNY